MMRGYWNGPGAEPFGHHMGGLGIAGMVLMIVLWIAVIVAIVIGIRAMVLHSRRNRAAATAATMAAAASYPPVAAPAPTASASPSSLAILEERYARGEIDRDEFFQRKQDLGLTGPAVPPTTAPVPTLETPAAPESTS